MATANGWVNHTQAQADDTCTLRSSKGRQGRSRGGHAEYMVMVGVWGAEWISAGPD